MFNKYRMSSVSSNLNKEVLLIIGLFIILTLYCLFRLDVLESFFLSFFFTYGRKNHSVSILFRNNILSNEFSKLLISSFVFRGIFLDKIISLSFVNLYSRLFDI